MKTFKCPTCGRVTEALASEVWCPGPAGSTKKHIQPVAMKALTAGAPAPKAKKTS